MEILILNPERKTNPEPRSLKAFSSHIAYQKLYIKEDFLIILSNYIKKI